MKKPLITTFPHDLNALLTPGQKYFILYTKGCFSNYKDPEKVIIGQALLMYPEQVNHHNLVNFAIRTFDVLLKSGAIDMNGRDVHTWYVEEMYQLVNRLTPPTLYEWLIENIQWSNVPDFTGIDLNAMAAKMKPLERKELK